MGSRCEGTVNHLVGADRDALIELNECMMHCVLLNLLCRSLCELIWYRNSVVIFFMEMGRWNNMLRANEATLVTRVFHSVHRTRISGRSVLWRSFMSHRPDGLDLE